MATDHPAAFECESCHAQVHFRIWRTVERREVWKCINCGHWNPVDEKDDSDAASEPYVPREVES